jgi:HEAT repeat protein
MPTYTLVSVRRAGLLHSILALSVAAAAGCGAKAPYEGKTAAELERMLHDTNPAVQAQGAYGLSLLGPEARDAVPALIEALTKETIVRQNAALALGHIGPDAKAAVPALIGALSDSEWTVRRQAALALGEIGAEAGAAIPQLEKLRHDKDRLVRHAATQALAQVKGVQ